MLPFIVGVAAGAAVVYAFGNRKEIQKGLEKSISKAKDVAKEGMGKSKELACDVKKSVDSTIECIKTKKSAPKKEIEEA